MVGGDLLTQNCRDLIKSGPSGPGVDPAPSVPLKEYWQLSAPVVRRTALGVLSYKLEEFGKATSSSLEGPGRRDGALLSLRGN